MNDPADPRAIPSYTGSTSASASGPYVAEASPGPGSDGLPATAPVTALIQDGATTVATSGVKLDFNGTHLYTWIVPPDLPDGYLEVHTFSVDSAGNLYGGDNQYGRTQKFVPKPDADPKLLIRTPWVAR